MGRIPFCKCGIVALWSSDVTSNQQSQQLFDPYTFTHILHGFLIYFLVWILARRLPPQYRLIIAVILESAWEIFENTNFVINRYRAQTISYDYYGDSIFNNLGDILAMASGFLLAWKFPTWFSVVFVILLDLSLMYFIRDSLIINIIMLIHPIDAIKQWQMTGS